MLEGTFVRGGNRTGIGLGSAILPRMRSLLVVALLASACSSSPTAPTTAAAPAHTTPGLALVITGQSNALNFWYYVFKNKPNAYPTPVTCDSCLSQTAIDKWAPGTDLWTKLETDLHQPVTAVVWWQGEEDGLRNNPHYAADLRDLLARMRRASGNPNLLVVVVKLLPRDFYAAIITAQQAVTASDPNTLLVSVDDLPLLDESHPSEEGYNMTAVRILAAIATRY